MNSRSLKKALAELSQEEKSRVIAKIRYYDGENGKPGKLKYFTVGDCKTLCKDGKLALVFKLRRGGELRFLPGFLSPQRCRTIVEELGMDACEDYTNHSLLRQYRIQNQQEPRLHGLISCDNPIPAEEMENEAEEDASPSNYRYHQIVMKPFHHMSEYPKFAKMAKQAAKNARVKKWKIGCDAILYRNGNDCINFHSDNTQGETAIFCLTAESEEPREVKVRVGTEKFKTALEDGDEVISIFPGAGDAYQMDGEMQRHYVHAVPKKKEKICTEEEQQQQEISPQRRVALIFRDGDPNSRGSDSGSDATNFKGKRSLTTEERYPLGSMEDKLILGKIYDRNYLLEHSCITNVEGGVSGMIAYGVCAIVISRQSSERNEKDEFDTIYYTSNGHQRGGALFACWQKGDQPIRVFRSSKLSNAFRAVPPPEESKKVFYRYDGLYQVVSCCHIDANGHENNNPKVTPRNEVEYTFCLRRVVMSKNGKKDFCQAAPKNSADYLRRCRKAGTMPAADFDVSASKKSESVLVSPEAETNVAGSLGQGRKERRKKRIKRKVDIEERIPRKRKQAIKDHYDS